MSFPRYLTYKDCETSWLNKIPEHWDITSLKRIAILKSGDSITADSIAESDEYPVYGGNGIRGYTGSFTHDGHYPIVGRQGALCGNVNYAEGRFWASEHAVVISPLKDLSIRWLGETLRAMNLNQYSVSAAQPGLSVETVGNLLAPLPPKNEQLAIASFLNRETTKIDTLIAEQQRLIELLQEKRQAAISHAVTKGLNPNAPMKNSGVEWLGEVPEHWDTTPMRRILIKIEQGWSPECLASPAEESEWGVVKAGCVNGGIFNPLNNKTLPSHLKPPLEYEIQAGDLLMCRASGSPDLIGSAAYIDKVRPRLLLSDKIFRLRTIERVDSRYLADVLSSTPLRQQIRQSISGAVGLANNLPQSEIKDFVVPLPPAKEQDEIHEFLAAETERLKILLDESESLIRLLEERRSALISAAVTGQIDVRGLALEVAA